jgi:hypothetical protein
MLLVKHKVAERKSVFEEIKKPRNEGVPVLRDL